MCLDVAIAQMENILNIHQIQYEAFTVLSASCITLCD